MSCSVHIVRQLAEGQEAPITLEEWNVFIEADPELKRPGLNHPNYSETLVLLPSDDTMPEEWQWLSWTRGSISSDYPQQAMLRKIGQVARNFGAVVMSDEGDVWTIDDEGRVSIPGVLEPRLEEDLVSASTMTVNDSKHSVSQPPPLPVVPVEIAPQPWFLFIQCSGPAIFSDSTKELLAEAVSTSLQHYPASIPIADLEQACRIAEHLMELGYHAEVLGYDRTKGEQAATSDGDKPAD